MLIRLYTALLWLYLPIYLLRLYWRGRTNAAYRQRWRERLGYISRPAQPGSLWIHAVSVGETQAIAPFIQRLQQAHPACPICLTHSTPTGAAQARRLFGQRIQQYYFPYDLPHCIRRFLHRVQPRAIILVETELWPNLLRESERRQIPVILVNARLSVRSQHGYQRLGYLSRQTVARLHWVAAQTAADAERLHSLGIPRTKFQVTGNLKYDQPIPDPNIARTLRQQWPSVPTWIAASTHTGEDAILLAAHTRLRQQHPDALLILVPRHPERFDAVAELIQHSGHPLVRRSAGASPNHHTSVYLGDTMGELSILMGAADIAFIGGSLVNTGGHNMLEAAAQSIPVCFGPYTHNFAQIAQQLLAHDGARRITDVDDLTRILHYWFTNPTVRIAIGQAGQRYVRCHQGAVDKLYQQLQRNLFNLSNRA